MSFRRHIARGLTFVIVVGSAAGRASADASLQQAITEAIHETGYDVIWQAGTPFLDVPGAYQAPNRAQHLRTFFTDDGVRVQPRTAASPAWSWGLTLTGIGYENDLQPAPAATMRVDDNRVIYRRGSLDEWYVNDARGLEQGFTLAARPGQACGRLLRLEMDMCSDLTPALRGSDSVVFADVTAAPVLRFDTLFAFDAAGRHLPAHFTLEGQRLTILVDDAHATYPITIDPLLSTDEAILVGCDDDVQTVDHFGYSVSIDGDTAVVGAPQDHIPANLPGVAYVFQRVGVSWHPQAKLVPTTPITFEQFGYSVDVSGDRIVVGAPFSTFGRAVVFLRTNSVWTEQQVLSESPSPTFDDRYGHSVAVSGDTIAVGVPRDDDTFTGAGSVFVYVWNGASWVEEQKLHATVPGITAEFGFSVDLDGDNLAVGAYHDVPTSGLLEGSAYVFVRNAGNWTEQDKLNASDGDTLDEFGTSIAINGDAVVVGSPLDDDLGAESGSAYVFRRSGVTWSQEDKVDGGFAGNALQNFGRSVSIDGDTMVVGAPGTDFFFTPPGGMSTFFTNPGSAYVFTFNGASWDQQQILIDTTSPIDGQQLGISVSVSGDTVLTGAYTDDVGAEAAAGSAFVFTRSGTTWTEEQNLSALDTTVDDLVGWSVDLDGDTAIVGAPQDDRVANLAGAAYIFVRDNMQWTKQAKLIGCDTAATDRFGWSVDLDGDSAIVGAYLHTHSGKNQAGAAYVFTRSGTTWTEEDKLTANDADNFDHLGFSVAISGDLAAVGADTDNHADGADAGAVYTYTRSGTVWSFDDKLVAGDAEPGALFGESVGLDGNNLIVGAPLDDGTGSAYPFVRQLGNFWLGFAKIQASDAEAGDNFGQVVAMSGSTAVVGSPRDDDACPGDPNCNSGSAYVQSGAFFAAQEKLTASDAAGGDQFGRGVGIAGDRTIVGAPSDTNAGGAGAGSAYVFASSAEFVGEFGLWKLSERVIDSDFRHFQLPVTVGFSDGQFDLVVHALHDTTGEFLFRPEPVEDQFPVATNTPGDFFDRFQSAPHGSFAPAIEEAAGPIR